MLLLPIMVGLPPLYSVSRASWDPPRPAIVEIKIDQHHQSRVYTSGSTIAGYVQIRVSRDIPFDDVDIQFTGMAATRLELLRSTPYCFKPFMKLRMPIRNSDLPPDRVLHAPGTYIIPFHFVVPHNLTIGACNHHCTCQAVREQHLRLPPSMGAWDADDWSPDSTHIEYAIKARITRSVPGASPIQLAEGHRIVKVLPSLPEDAPLAVNDDDQRYKMQKEKTVRKGLFSTKKGQVTVASSQPSAIMLSADGHRASSSSVNINLEYVPASTGTPPPKINSVTAKVVSTTFFSVVPMNHLPNMGSRTQRGVSPNLSYSTSKSIFSRSLDASSWTKHDIPTLRHDSGYASTLGDGCGASIIESEERSLADTSSSSSSSSTHSGDTDINTSSHRGSSSSSSGSHGRGSISKKDRKKKKQREKKERKEKAKRAKSASKHPRWSPIKYTTEVEIPFTIPSRNRNVFVPSFHSCLISRTYTLRLNLSIGPAFSAVRLSIPFQVGVETVHDPQGGGELPSFETAVAEGAGIGRDDQAEAGPYAMRPRLMHTPESNRRLDSMLPQYDFTTAHHGPGFGYY
ncbi:hypothetical protein ESCO_005180 [Escovopsis weberi]|uniref:Bul1 C-terminal domain-containing protein n=1 Tax=Escovopsis weberi TaxID=150374 RepID=A0A0M8N7G1_ESCWE|nr:hypothetical protein ESCO_005180 [Escovopsis weberi]